MPNRVWRILIKVNNIVVANDFDSLGRQFFDVFRDVELVELLLDVRVFEPSCERVAVDSGGLREL